MHLFQKIPIKNPSSIFSSPPLQERMNSAASNFQQIPDHPYDHNSFMYVEDNLCNYDYNEWWPATPLLQSSNQVSCLDQFPSFDAVCDDFALWDPSFPHQYEVDNMNNFVDVKPLMSVNPAETAVSVDHRIDQTPANQEERFHQGSVIRYGNKSSGLQYDEIRKYFDVPISEAAKELKVGVTVLKKRCRELNISRWPHRKIKSLTFLIQNAKDLGLTGEVSMLEEHRRMIHRIPEMELTERTKKLRQACFKANYKKRRALGTTAAANN